MSQNEAASTAIVIGCGSECQVENLTADGRGLFVKKLGLNVPGHEGAFADMARQLKEGCGRLCRRRQKKLAILDVRC